MAVISRKQPGRIPDLLAYETLIIEAHMEYSGDAWLGYDIRFRQCAATDTTKNWAIIDPTLWNLAFSGKARATLAANFALVCPMCHQTVPGLQVNQHPECPHHREPSLAQYGFVTLGIANHKQDVHTPVAHISTSTPSAARIHPSSINVTRLCFVHITSCQQFSSSSTLYITPAATTIPAPYVTL